MAATTAARTAGVYRTLLGCAFDALHPHIREAHLAPIHAEGVMDVVHGSHPVTPVLVGLMNLPAAGSALPVALEVTSTIDPTGCEVMHWSRRFGDSRLRTRQSAWRGLLLERSGAGSITYALREEQGSLVYAQRSMRFLSLPIGSALTPVVHALASPAPTGWHVDVTVRWRGHLICRYSGGMCVVAAA